MKTTIPSLLCGREIRRTLHTGKWWFAVADVVEALTCPGKASATIQEMRKRDSEMSKEWGQFVIPLLLEFSGGRQEVECTDTAGVFRILQSIDSPQAEPFKRWLARVGYERVLEFEDPELAIQPDHIAVPDERILRGLNCKTNAWYRRPSCADRRMEKSGRKRGTGARDPRCRNFQSHIWCRPIGILRAERAGSGTICVIT